MDWTINSEGFTSEWFIRYAHPTQSAWKQILDYMLFTDKQGNLTVEKHVLLYSKLSTAQKLKLLPVPGLSESRDSSVPCGANGGC